MRRDLSLQYRQKKSATDHTGGKSRVVSGSWREKFAERQLRRRNGDTIGGHNLRLVGEDVAASRIHYHFEPLHIVGSVLLVVAEGLNARKVLEAPAQRILEWLIHPEVVRIAVYIGDRLAERDHLLAQRQQVILEAIRLAVGLGESARIAHRRPRWIRCVPTWIGLRNDHDGSGTAGLRFVECFLQPGDIGLVASGEFVGVGRDVAQVIAGALDIERYIGDSAYCPAAVLHARRRAAHAQAERRGLHLLTQTGLPLRERS